MPGSSSWLKQWRTGYSAKTLACCWEDCDGSLTEMPNEIAKLFASTLEGESPELLLAIPEHKVRLPGGHRASQVDVFALITAAGQTFSVAVVGFEVKPCRDHSSFRL